MDEPNSLLSLVKNFYSDLYTSENISSFDLNVIISKIETKDIPNNIIEDLENDISNDEVKIALSQINQNKSPGLDSLTVNVEFYQSLWSVIEDDFVAVLKDSYKRGQLCKSMNFGLIRLIYIMRGSRFDL